MTASDCPSPETLAALPSLQEAERDLVCSHLADCSACRREVSLAALADHTALPAARLDPARLAAGVSAPRVRPPGRFPWIAATLSSAAALLLLASGAFLWHALRSTSSTSDTPAPVVRSAPIPSIPAPPKAAESGPASPDPEPRPRSQTPESVPAPAPSRTDTPPSPTEVPPAGVARENSVVAQAVPVFPLAGSVTLRGQALTKEGTAGPSDILSSPDGGNLRVMEHLRVHLARGADISVSWSQSLNCPSVSVRKGEAIVELGPTPRTVHVSAEGIGLCLEAASGDLHVAAETGVLRVAPLTAPARLRLRDGTFTPLPAGTAVLLGPSGESFLPGAAPSEDRFPTRKPAATPGAAAPPPPPAAVPDPFPACKALRTSGYRFSAQGRRLRTGAYKDNVVASAIEDFAAVRPLGEPAATHVRRGNRAWNQLGVLKGEDERIVATLRAAQAPHVQLDLALRGARGEPEIRSEKTREVDAWVFRWDFEPARIRNEMDGLIDRAAVEERLEKPREIYWDTLEGSLEVAVAKENPRVLRVADRRRVAFLPSSPSAARAWYQTDTVTAFYDHGRVVLTLPPPK